MKPAKENPIIDAGLEISVSYAFPSDAIVGIIYNFLHQKDADVELHKLPVSNIPDEIRKMDANLKDKPTHQLTCKEGFIQVGENVLCIGGAMPYSSWGQFKKFISDTVELLRSNSLLGKVKFAKLRYLNFYQDNVFERISLNISMPDVENICGGSAAFRAEIPFDNNIIGVLQITNGVHVKNVSIDLDDDGSLIELQMIAKEVRLDELSDIIQNLHDKVESLFIKLTNRQ